MTPQTQSNLFALVYQILSMGRIALLWLHVEKISIILAMDIQT
jgi:hypothetical protein